MLHQLSWIQVIPMDYIMSTIYFLLFSGLPSVIQSGSGFNLIFVFRLIVIMVLSLGNRMAFWGNRNRKSIMLLRSFRVTETKSTKWTGRNFRMKSLSKYSIERACQLRKTFPNKSKPGDVFQVNHRSPSPPLPDHKRSITYDSVFKQVSTLWNRPRLIV